MLQIWCVEFLKKNIILRKIAFKFGKHRAITIVKQLRPFLRKESRVLDIGAGTCNVCQDLLDEGRDVTPLDVRDLSLIEGCKPILYDGDRIPFGDNAFDVALILMVLHHTNSPEKIIAEAKRVSKRIIIIEDVYSNIFHQYVTYFFDSLLNLEFFGHPHTNKKDRLWKEVFKNLGLKIIHTGYWRSHLVFQHATYCLEK